MKASAYKQLGLLASKVRRVAVDYAEDPISAECGYWGNPQPDMERIVRKAGFANLHHFYAVLTRRTSGRWVFMCMPALETTIKGKLAARRMRLLRRRARHASRRAA